MNNITIKAVTESTRTDGKRYKLVTPRIYVEDAKTTCIIEFDEESALFIAEGISPTETEDVSWHSADDYLCNLIHQAVSFVKQYQEEHMEVYDIIEDIPALYNMSGDLLYEGRYVIINERTGEAIDEAGTYADAEELIRYNFSF